MLNCLLTHERDDFAEVSTKTQQDIKELDGLSTKHLMPLMISSKLDASN